VTEAALASSLARRYRIVKKLGAGGMGAVFLAQQVALGNRPVALKVLSRKLLDDPEFLLRFHNEGTSTARIRHSNVVTIYESGQADDGTPYIAMEYLEGEPLRQTLRTRGALPVAECTEILQQAARGLNAAHKMGIIHRDLKPDNIFLTRGDEGELMVKIVDFGIAKMRESATHTLTGQILGTPAYMSYEQAFGMKGDELDARSDIYSLGVVVYEMVTGRVPFHSDTPQGYLRKHLLEEPPPLRAAAPGLPISSQVEATVMKALAKDREQRYPSVLDFARDFARAASAPAPPSSPQPFATTRRVEPCAPVAVPVVRPPEIAVQTPPPEPAVLRGEAAPRPQAEPRVALQSGPRFEMVQREKRSRVGITSLVAATVVAIVVALLWVYWPSPPNPANREAPVPSVRSPQANPAPPSPAPEEQAHPVAPTRENPPAATDRAGIARKVNAAVSEGDSYMDRGEYDQAIAAYQSGLVVDPGNPQVLAKIQRAKNAKAAESASPQ
jgi:serine/threonine-protein kinase